MTSEADIDCRVSGKRDQQVGRIQDGRMTLLKLPETDGSSELKVVFCSSAIIDTQKLSSLLTKCVHERGVVVACTLGWLRETIQ